MKDAARLMVKVFAVVFGAGSAVVVLLYLLLGLYYLHERVERTNQVNAHTSVPGAHAGDVVETYDPKSIPKGAVVPDAQLDCAFVRDAGFCAVLVSGRLVAFISRDEVKASLAGWVTAPNGSH